MSFKTNKFAHFSGAESFPFYSDNLMGAIETASRLSTSGYVAPLNTPKGLIERALGIVFQKQIFEAGQLMQPFLTRSYNLFYLTALVVENCALAFAMPHVLISFGALIENMLTDGFYGMSEQLILVLSDPNFYTLAIAFLVTCTAHGLNAITTQKFSHSLEREMRTHFFQYWFLSGSYYGKDWIKKDPLNTTAKVDAGQALIEGIEKICDDWVQRFNEYIGVSIRFLGTLFFLLKMSTWASFTFPLIGECSLPILLLVSISYAFFYNAITSPIEANFKKIVQAKTEVKRTLSAQTLTLETATERFAFERGALNEYNSLETLSKRVQSIHDTSLFLRFWLSFSNQVHWQLGPILGTLTEILVGGKIRLGDVISMAKHFNQVVEHFTLERNRFDAYQSLELKTKLLKEFLKCMNTWFEEMLACPVERNQLDFFDTDCLRVTNLLVHTVDKEMLSTLNMELLPGDRVLVRGKSGCGKSTFFRTLRGLWPYASGAIETHTEPLFLPQQPYIKTNSTLLEVILYPEVPQEAIETVRKEFIKDRLLEMGFANTGYIEQLEEPGINWNSGLLSEGQRKRIALLKILYKLNFWAQDHPDEKPPLIVLDEPWNGLDEENISIAKALLRKAIEERETALIYICHQDDEAVTSDSLHTRVLKMARGKSAVYEA